MTKSEYERLDRQWWVDALAEGKRREEADERLRARRIKLNRLQQKLWRAASQEGSGE